MLADNFLSLLKHPAAPVLEPTISKLIQAAESRPLSGPAIHALVADGLFYFKQFIRLLRSVPDESTGGKATKFLVPLLKVHWMWLLKHLVRPLLEAEPTA